jgi:hypothetical protein
MNVNQLIIVAVFGIVFIVSCTALKKAGLFNHPARVVISACVAALCIISLFDISTELTLRQSSPSGIAARPMENDPAKTDQTLRKVILIPYLAFLLSLPVLLLVWLWSKLFCFPRQDRRYPDKSRKKDKSEVDIALAAKEKFTFWLKNPY